MPKYNKDWHKREYRDHAENFLCSHKEDLLLHGHIQLYVWTSTICRQDLIFLRFFCFSFGSCIAFWTCWWSLSNICLQLPLYRDSKHWKTKDHKICPGVSTRYCFVHVSLPLFCFLHLSGFAKAHRSFKVTKHTKAQRWQRDRSNLFAWIVANTRICK